MRIKRKLALFLIGALLVTSINVTPSIAFAAEEQKGTATKSATGSTKLLLTIEKKDGPVAPSGLAVIAPSKYGVSDGQITGTTTAMEYSTASDFSYAQDCTGEGITNLAAGTYYVRVKTTDTTKAGAVATVTVPDGESKVESIEISSTSHKTAYKVGEDLDVTGLTIRVVKTNTAENVEAMQVDASMVSGFNPTPKELVPQELTITYGEKTTTYDISIEKKSGSGIRYIRGGSASTTNDSIYDEKSKVKEEISNSVDVSKYDAEDQNFIDQEIKTATAAIEKASSVEEITKIVEELKAKMDSIKTEEEKSKEKKKEVVDVISKFQIRLNSKFVYEPYKRYTQLYATTTKGAKELKELQEKGYTVKYVFYKSTSSKAKTTKQMKLLGTSKDSKYLVKKGANGIMYYYRAILKVYDENGKLVAKTELGQCKYGNRRF